MRLLLFLWGLLSGGMGLMALLGSSVSKSAVHEISALVALLIATVAFGCAGVMDAIFYADAQQHTRLDHIRQMLAR